MKTKKRSIRRHHRTRLIKRFLKYEMLRDIDDKELQIRIAVHTYNHIKCCSCSVCCNDRRNPFAGEERLTLQERRADDNFADGLLEYYS